MDTFGDDFKVPQRAVRKAYEVEHESLPQAAVAKLMASDIEHISGIFGVDVCGLIILLLYAPHSFLKASTASLLLRYMNWNKERLIEKYMDNASAVSVAAGISPPSKVHTSFSAAGPERSQGTSSSARSGGLRRPTRQTPGMFILIFPGFFTNLIITKQHQLQNRSLLCVQSVTMIHNRRFRHSRVTIHSAPVVGMHTSHPRFGRRASTRSGAWPRVVAPLQRIRSSMPPWGTTQLLESASTSFLRDTLLAPTPT